MKSPRADPGAVLITHRFDLELTVHLRNGGSALLLADPEDGLPLGSPLRIVRRGAAVDVETHLSPTQLLASPNIAK